MVPPVTIISAVFALGKEKEHLRPPALGVRANEGAINVRFGSFAAEPSRKKIHQCPLWAKSRHVRRNKACQLYPDNDRESGFPHEVMSALTPKADMCGAITDVRFGPIADMA